MTSVYKKSALMVQGFKAGSNLLCTVAECKLAIFMQEPEDVEVDLESTVRAEEAAKLSSRQAIARIATLNGMQPGGGGCNVDVFNTAARYRSVGYSCFKNDCDSILFELGTKWIEQCDVHDEAAESTALVCIEMHLRSLQSFQG